MKLPRMVTNVYDPNGSNDWQAEGIMPPVLDELEIEWNLGCTVYVHTSTDPNALLQPGDRIRVTVEKLPSIEELRSVLEEL